MATTIDQLLGQMDERLERDVAANTPTGYFAAVYRAVTARVRDGIEAGEFDDADRMERFDVGFAGYYLEAAAAHDAGRRPSRSWQVAFEHAGQPLLVLQHVLLGMNAHINLDLGLAAADAVPGADIAELQQDFERINDVLADMVDRMQAAVATVSPWTRVVDRVGLRMDEAVATWSLARARDHAWRFAEQVAVAGDDRQRLVDQRDAAVARIGAAIARPGRLTRSVVLLAHQRERSDVGAVVAALRARGAPLPG